jgi:hypothetical protein
MSRNFKELLLQTSQYSLDEQKEALDTTIENWKNNYDQNDDMIVIGFEIKD